MAISGLVVQLNYGNNENEFGPIFYLETKPERPMPEDRKDGDTQISAENEKREREKDWNGLIQWLDKTIEQTQKDQSEKGSTEAGQMLIQVLAKTSYMIKDFFQNVTPLREATKYTSVNVPLEISAADVATLAAKINAEAGLQKLQVTVLQAEPQTLIIKRPLSPRN